LGLWSSRRLDLAATKLVRSGPTCLIPTALLALQQHKRSRGFSAFLRQELYANFTVRSPDHLASMDTTANGYQQSLRKVSGAVGCDARAARRNVEDDAFALDAARVHEGNHVHWLAGLSPPLISVELLLEPPTRKQVRARSFGQSKHVARSRDRASQPSLEAIVRVYCLPLKRIARIFVTNGGACWVQLGRPLAFDNQIALR
jgi:hypothetical protein